MTKINRMLVAEFLGTFLLASAVLNGFNPFIALGILVLLFGSISGANVNPAVSAGLASVKKLTTDKMFMFWVVQILGAIAARAVFAYLTDSDFGSFEFAEIEGREFVSEILGTGVFLFGIVMAVAHKLDGIKLAAAVGGSLFLGAAFGSVLNPAIALALQETPVSALLGPVIGGILGASAAHMVMSKK